MKSKMSLKSWSWTLAAVLSISSLSFSSCSNNDENLVDTPKTAPTTNQPTMKLSGNTWVRAYEAKGKAGAGSTADKNTDFSYVYVIDAYKFTEDGKGEFNRMPSQAWHRSQMQKAPSTTILEHAHSTWA